MLPQVTSKKTGEPLGVPLGQALIEMHGIEWAQKRMVWLVSYVLGPETCTPEFRDEALKQVGL